MPVIASSTMCFFLVTLPCSPCMIKLQSAMKAPFKLLSSRLRPQQIWLHIHVLTLSDVQEVLWPNG